MLAQPGNVVTTPSERRAYVLGYRITDRGILDLRETGIVRSAHTPELAPITGIHVQYLDNGALGTLDNSERRRCVVIDGDGTTLATS